METNWCLNKIYDGVDGENFKKEYAEYQQLISEINKWAEENLTGEPNAETTEEYLRLKNRLEGYSSLAMYIQLGLSVDTSNAQLQRLMDNIENISSQNALHEALFLKWLKGAESLDFIDESEYLREHRFYLNEQAQLAKHTLSPEQELIIAQMKTTGSTTWQKLWEQVTSNLEVDYNGEEITLSQVRALADNGDKNIRKQAFEAEISAYKKIETAAAFALNGIKGEVLNTSKMRGYANPLEQVLEQSRIDDKILNAMFDAIEQSLPYFQKYFNKKAEVLNETSGLNFYSIFAPINNCSMNYELDEAKQAVIAAFTDFNPQLGEFAANEFENRHLDLLPKRGKVGGAFCESIQSKKEIRYLINFTGSFNDAVTIAHELGHGYHSHLLFDNSVLNSDYPMPIAETASTLCECIFINHALKKADKQEQIYILENDIQGIAQTLVDIYSRFLFEDKVFEMRKQGSLSVEELKEIMVEAQKKTYGRLNTYHPYMWACKPHYYDADYNYYNFPYAFGMLLSKGLYSLYKKDSQAFMPLYNKLLSATGTADLAEVAKIAGIDLYDSNFWLSGIEIIKNDIDKLISLL